MTNSEKIKRMSDEELSCFLDRVHEFPCDVCCNNLSWCRRNNAPEPVCRRHILDWLKEKSKE